MLGIPSGGHSTPAKGYFYHERHEEHESWAPGAKRCHKPFRMLCLPRYCRARTYPEKFLVRFFGTKRRKSFHLFLLSVRYRLEYRLEWLWSIRSYFAPATYPGPRNTLPGSAPVWLPFSITETPLTST